MNARYAALALVVAGAGFAFAGRPAGQAAAGAPPNEPAEVAFDGERIVVRYNGSPVVEGRLTNPSALRGSTVNAFVDGGAVNQVLALTARSGREPVELVATVTTGPQGFPAEADRPLRGLPIVRHSSGLSRSLRNNGVYDRQWDWALSVDDQPRTQTRIVPLEDAPERRTFRVESRGSEILLRFRPRFYQQHRGLRFFEPWTYQVWKAPIVGWCSWFAFFDRVTEQDMRRTADVMADALAPFGFEYLQMDDGYQRDVGAPDYPMSWAVEFAATDTRPARQGGSRPDL